MRIDLPGGLEPELVKEIARGVRNWWLTEPNYTKEARFVSIDRVKEQTVVTPMEFE